jgi:hypothetical protein
MKQVLPKGWPSKLAYPDERFYMHIYNSRTDMKEGTAIQQIVKRSWMERINRLRTHGPGGPYILSITSKTRAIDQWYEKDQIYRQPQ